MRMADRYYGGKWCECCQGFFAEYHTYCPQCGLESRMFPVKVNDKSLFIDWPHKDVLVDTTAATQHL